MAPVLTLMVTNSPVTELTVYQVPVGDRTSVPALSRLPGAPTMVAVASAGLMLISELAEVIAKKAPVSGSHSRDAEANPVFPTSVTAPVATSTVDKAPPGHSTT
ncbi:MAG: hypothetical protein MAG451_01632 [Anaerolineales bacterium]|nr:hypothetical protein [Anaerolineales bacterium]